MTDYEFKKTFLSSLKSSREASKQLAEFLFQVVEADDRSASSSSLVNKSCGFSIPLSSSKDILVLLIKYRF